jgi:cell division protein FtsB
VASQGHITSDRERAGERERRGRRRLRRVLRWIGALLVLAAAFFAGLAVGRAVEEDQARGDQTLIRTLVPTTLAPPETVTVTVSNP